MNRNIRQGCHQGSFDRLMIILVLVSTAVALSSVGLIMEISIGIIFVLVSILAVRFLVYFFKNRPKSNPNCWRRQETVRMLVELAHDMDVKIHATKSLDISPELRGAFSGPRLFFLNGKVHCFGRVCIGCTILCGINNIALRGILAHELAHLKKHHSIKHLALILSYIAVAVYLIVLMSPASNQILLILVAAATWIILFSLASWHSEYEADSVAADYVGNEAMISTLEQFARLIYRPSDTLLHPSFKKRISRLST